MENEIPNVNEAKPVRPRLLTILCILTFISSGLNFLSFLISFLSPRLYTTGLEMFGDMYGIPNWRDFLLIPRSFFLINSVLFAGSLAGAAMMWNLKRTGFHIYTIAQILLIFASTFILSGGTPNLFDILLSFMFVYLYSRFLKIMS